MKYTLCSLFAGIGGFDLAFKQLNVKIKYATDINKWCKLTYDNNFKKKLVLGDISNKKFRKQIPKTDILTAGFPCQSFSIAGNKKGLKDPRGKLVFSLLKVIKKNRPKVLLFENVKNFKTIDNSTAYNYVKNKLKKYGYHIRTKVLNTKEYTKIPQNRERLFIVGLLKSKVPNYKQFKFPKPSSYIKYIPAYLQSQKHIDGKYYLFNNPNYVNMVNQINKLTPAPERHMNIYKWRGVIRVKKNFELPTLCAMMGKGGTNVPLIKDKLGVRQLTPRECFRFQGYPNSYKFPIIANSHLYTQIGNSVTVSLIKRIGKRIIKILSQ